MKPKVFAYYHHKNGKSFLKSNIFHKFTEVELTFDNGALQIKQVNPNQLNLRYEKNDTKSNIKA